MSIVCFLMKDRIAIAWVFSCAYEAGNEGHSPTDGASAQIH